MKIAYITVKLPYGRQETFIIPEIKEVIRQGHEALVFPFRPDGEIFHREAEGLRDITHSAKMLSFKVFAGALFEFLRRPVKGAGIILKVVLNSRSPFIALKNFAAIPKGFYAARVFRQAKVEHIHAHWASTTATVAYIASHLTGIPWSFTAHRWDIAENNLIKDKVKSGVFARAIDENGRQEIIDITKNNDLKEKALVIHMGVKIPILKDFPNRNNRIFSIICPANLRPIKGHKYLIEACKILDEKEINFTCLIAGDGPLEGELKSLVRSLNLSERVKFIGRLPHEKLLEMYRNKDVNLVVLPSIVTHDGEKEGIPVALMEAMAYGIPVISTETGGIPELVRDAGLLVPPGDSNGLADAIAQVTSDTLLYQELQSKGRKRVEEDFEIGRNTVKLLSKIKSSIT